ncbi:MAG: hypothetical protein KGJ23_08015 [Euryarchaeota archaeon]|nr:hypothetical protein [Euryarchaeota archaeon]MDE1836546.1 hypothetical protein [Euryarchaeota archaeon]MDE1879259.1 hypothetical protein [Euryarchaeota archaeon]MDE2044516.1 hypothetical protein [Thermoplasmata archaeon]
MGTNEYVRFNVVTERPEAVRKVLDPYFRVGEESVPMAVLTGATGSGRGVTYWGELACSYSDAANEEDDSVHKEVEKLVHGVDPEAKVVSKWYNVEEPEWSYIHGGDPETDGTGTCQ